MHFLKIITSVSQNWERVPSLEVCKDGVRDESIRQPITHHINHHIIHITHHITNTFSVVQLNELVRNVFIIDCFKNIV